MRVITGSARGMSLKTLDGELTRPTSEKVKEAVFSAVQFEIEGARVLDLFAGSGQLGIESLSRGAKNAVFVDSNKSAAEIIKANVEKTGFSDRAEIFVRDYASFLRMNIRKFDLVFLDPPYASGLLIKAAESVSDFVDEKGVVICEHPCSDTMPEKAGELSKYREYKYGKTAVTIYRKD